MIGNTYYRAKFSIDMARNWTHDLLSWIEDEIQESTNRIVNRHNGYRDEWSSLRGTINMADVCLLPPAIGSREAVVWIEMTVQYPSGMDEEQIRDAAAHAEQAIDAMLVDLAFGLDPLKVRRDEAILVEHDWRVANSHAEQKTLLK